MEDRVVPSLTRLAISGNGRHLVDGSGKPFLIQGDSAWTLIIGTTQAEAEQYLTDRANKGFNAILVDLIEDYYNTPPVTQNQNGVAPFTGAGRPFIDPPNETYFQYADWVINRADQLGMYVFLLPAFAGHPGPQDGFIEEMVTAGSTRMYEWGKYVGNRYKNYENIVWVQGGDRNPSASEIALIDQVAKGIRDADPTDNLQTAHTRRLSDSGQQNWSAADEYPPATYTWLTLNATYTGDASVGSYETYTETLYNYNRTPVMTSFLIEDYYELDQNLNQQQQRAQKYWSLLSGSSGALMGNTPLWAFNYDSIGYPSRGPWESQLNSPLSNDMTRLGSLFSTRAWHNLVPDQGHTVLTAGYGSSHTYVTAARTSDGTLAMAYVPSRTATPNLTFNMAQFSAPVYAKWFDPTNGTYTTIAGSPFANSGSRTFATPTANNSTNYGDWVLVLETAAPGLVGGLVGHWKLDNNTTDSSSYANNGTAFGSPTYNSTDKKAGTHSLNFDGVNDYVTIDAVQNDGLTGNFSFSGWIKTPAGTTQRAILGVNGSTGSNRFIVGFQASSNELFVGDSADGIAHVWEADTNTVVADNIWHHVAYTRSGSTGTLYVDGLSKATHVANFALTSSDKWSLGQEWDGGTASDFFTGLMDDIRIHKYALSATEVQNLFKGTLAAEWKFSESAGSTTAADSSGNADTATLTNGATFAAGRSGSGNALRLDGVNDYAWVANSTSVNLTKNFTLSAWIRPDVVNRWQSIISKATDANETQYNLTVNSSGKLAFHYERANNNYYSLNGGTLTAGAWQFVAATIDSSRNIKLYINGSQVASGTAPAETLASTSRVTIGRWDVAGTSGDQFDGLIDGARIHDTALSATEITNLYNQASLHAAGPAVAGRSAASLDQAALAPLVAEARARWAAAGADPRALARLRFMVADLEGNTLGLQAGTTIYLDHNAAGHGWSLGARVQPGRFDLLTVVSHELGHVLGLAHEHEGVMQESLAAGVRRLPAEHTDRVEGLPAVADLAVPAVLEAWLVPLLGRADTAAPGPFEVEDGPPAERPGVGVAAPELAAGAPEWRPGSDEALGNVGGMVVDAGKRQTDLLDAWFVLGTEKRQSGWPTW